MPLGSVTLKALHYKVLPERAIQVMARVKAIYPLVDLSYEDNELTLSGPVLRYNLSKRDRISKLLMEEVRRYEQVKGNGAAL